jgi:hypothetical protein
MKLRTMILIAIGFGLYALSHSLELRGDLAPLAASGVSPERAKFHLLALVVLLAGLGCFIAAGLGIFRGLRERF